MRIRYVISPMAVIDLLAVLPSISEASAFSARLRHSTESYRDAADLAAADGIITDDERGFLEQKRRELGIGEDLAEGILQEESTRRMRGLGEHCPTCGQRLGDSFAATGVQD